MVTVPAGFAPISLTFVSGRTGYALGTIECANGLCPALVRTDDGGRSWRSTNAPRIVTSRDTRLPLVRFADARNGWVFADEAWSTHDGGDHWAPVTFSDMGAGGGVLDMEASAGLVHAVVLDPAMSGAQVLSSPVGSDRFLPSSPRLQSGAGPIPTAPIVLNGPTGWIAFNNRGITDAVRLVDGRWQSWSAPCRDFGTATIVARTAHDLIARCDPGPAAQSPALPFYQRSRDGGSTFARVEEHWPANTVLFTAIGSSILVGDDHGRIHASFDDGQSFHEVYRGHSTTTFLRELGFTTREQAVVLESSADGATAHMVMSRDGGRTWIVTL
jgi:photosystem II stability/assembly factor-like uncharacterized protein